MKNIRKSNFEFMRITSMLFVVMWHVILHSNLYTSTTGTTKFFLEALILFGVVHINSFVIVTGYFQCDKKFKWSKFFHIFSITWFYKAAIATIFFVFLSIGISNLEYFKELMPLDFRDYWYINCYLILYLLTPFINKLINNLNQKDFRKMLIVQFILFSIMPLISNQGIIANNGYTIIQFIFMYFIGAYLRKYPVDNNIHFKNYSKNKKQLIFLFSFIFIFFINFILLNFSKTIMNMDCTLLNEFGSYLFNNIRMYSNPIVIIQSVLYFLFFSTLTFKNKIINFISKYTLEVYLIHENFYLLQYIYKLIKIDYTIKYRYYIVIIAVIATSLFIFFCCIIIGIIRNLMFSLIKKIGIFNGIKKATKKYIDEI